MKTKFLLILISVFNFQILFAQKVACIGNSITYGSGLSSRLTDCYPAQLAQMLGENYDVRNYGVSGSTLLKSGDKPYWQQPEYTAALSFAPDIVIIMLGTNDSKPWNWTPDSSLLFESDYKEFINSFKNLASNPVIIISYPCKAYNSNFGISDSVIVNAICPILKKISIDMGITLVDMHNETSGISNLFPDGIHPNKEGATRIANKFYSIIASPEFKSASVTDNDPKQINVKLTIAVEDSVHFNGFTVKVDNVVVPLDSVVLVDSTDLSIFLSDSILIENTITLSYSNGNVFSKWPKQLVTFGDTLLDNLLLGSSPRIHEVTTNKTGDTLLVRFNKKMLIPSDISALTLNADYNGPINVSILQCSFFNNDSTVLAFSLDTNVYRDYGLLFTYSGSSIASLDSGMLKPVTDFPVINISDGLPVHIVSAKVKSDGITLLLEFEKPMALNSSEYNYLYLYINGKRLFLNSDSIVNDTIQFTLSKSIHYGDIVTIKYIPGDIKAADNGVLKGFSNFAVTNEVNEPVWISIPGKVEAENFAFKSGMQTEATSDAGGGLNLGYISDGNWAEYTIANNTSQTQYQIAFRVAAPSTSGVISYYLDNILVAMFSCPSTGDFQVYTSVVKNISIPNGNHYLKMVATKGGFNLNYMDITSTVTGIGTKIAGANSIMIYPIPASDELIISSADFKPTQIDILDVTGNIVVSQSVVGEPVLHVPVCLPDGMYFVKISNENQYLFKKIVIDNK
jgi:lysophospholipase L1-like esterase